MLLFFARFLGTFGPHGKMRPAVSADIVAGIESLAEFLDLLPKLKVIVLFGKKSLRFENYVYEDGVPS